MISAVCASVLVALIFVVPLKAEEANEHNVGIPRLSGLFVESRDNEGELSDRFLIVHENDSGRLTNDGRKIVETEIDLNMGGRFYQFETLGVMGDDYFEALFLGTVAGLNSTFPTLRVEDFDESTRRLFQIENGVPSKETWRTLRKFSIWNYPQTERLGSGTVAKLFLFTDRDYTTIAICPDYEDDGLSFQNNVITWALGECLAFDPVPAIESVVSGMETAKLITSFQNTTEEFYMVVDEVNFSNDTLLISSLKLPTRTQYHEGDLRNWDRFVSGGSKDSNVDSAWVTCIFPVSILSGFPDIKPGQLISIVPRVREVSPEGVVFDCELG